MTKILVIGATGNIGLPLVDYLSKQDNVSIVAGAHDLEKDRRTLAKYPEVELRYFDFLDSESFKPAMADVEKIFFIRPPQLANPKVEMLPFLKFVQAKKVQRLVFVSLMGVEHNPMTPHHKIEKMIEELNIPHTFIRPSFFMQNLNTTHRFDIQKNHDLFIPAGHAKTSFIDTRDIGEVAGVTLLDDKYLNKKVNITGPQALTYFEIADLMTKTFGHTVTYSKPSLLRFRHTMIKRGLKKDYVNVMVMLYLITQMGNAKEVTDECSQVLDHAPRDMQTYLNDYKNQLS
ncbi:SDR family oxidoreductase [Companilactobacillus sp. FL22-1]|uniref:SDR family oxidoreductase n=1 Tax=Companilactobacillus sp. FL22-1 TaxID=3373892 RepID=UPI003754B52F